MDKSVSIFQTASASPGSSLNLPSAEVRSLLGDLVVSADGLVVPFKTHSVTVMIE